MCGIAGELRFDQKTPDLANLALVNNQMAPRGPDASGLYHHNQIALAHRRLKIIDLSDFASQPMTDSQLGLTLVFNGAIYNYPALRQELEAKGYSFFSQGDTEVILKAYHAWGEKCVEKFNGMFAFAIWNKQKQELFIARDRLGIKPLYYAKTSKALRFASSLPALLKYQDIDTHLNPRALHAYLSFHAVVPPPDTLLKGINKLPQGHWLKISADGKEQLYKYWNLDFTKTPEDLKRSEEEWKELVYASLMKSVKRRMIADVPVGVLLSGGLDSSLVVGLLHQAGCHNLKTFSIGFESIGDEKGDEFEYSDIVAQHFSTDHHQLVISPEQTLDSLAQTLHSMSEPMMSHDNVGFYLLSKEVSKHVKVVQSGQGADEIFAGYHWYPPMMDSQDPVADYTKAFLDRSHQELSEMLIHPEILSTDYSHQFVREHFSQPGAEAAVDKALRIDSTIMLPDDPVKRVDNMTMAWGLEARVPFLDHELVELSARIPAQFKVRGSGKYILAEVARSVIPHAVIDRPKGYFPVPALKYIQGPYLDYVCEALTSRIAKERNLFNPSYLEKLFSNPTEHITPLRGSKLWQVAVLELWLQSHSISSSIGGPS